MMEYKLNKISNPIGVIKSEVEGELKLKQVILLRELMLQKILFFVVSVFCSDRPNILRRVHYEEVNRLEDATHVYVQASDLTEYIESCHMKDNPSDEEGNVKSLYFTNRYQHYMYQYKSNCFKAIEFFVQGSSYVQLAQKQPISTNQVDHLLEYYGKSEIDIKVPSFLHLMWVEYKKPINFLLYYGVAVWAIEMMVVSVAITVVFTTTINSLIIVYIRGVMKKLQNACVINTEVIVQRQLPDQSFQEITIPSNMLVPGDIVFIKREMIIPFDCLLIQGSCQVNEANITGENVGIGKSQIPTDHHNDLFKYESSKSHLLYQGTNLIKIEDEYLKVLVVRSGFGSYKGQIIRALLYPKPFDKKFQNQCVKLTILMTIILLIGYLACLYRLIDIELPSILIVYRFLDIGIYSAPPAMPLLVAITNFVGLYRLKNNKILGQDPATSSQAGRIQTLCFDKTGTLTEDKVDLIGYQQVNQSDIKKKMQQQDINDITIDQKLFSICHEVTKINGKYDGDAMDIKMAEFSNLEISYDHEKKQHYSQSGDKRYYQIQLNQFHSEYQSMSIVCQELNVKTNESKYYFFIKGSPEKIQSLAVSTSLEEKKQLSVLTNEGYRILGYGYKEISSNEINQFLDNAREQQEKSITTLGFLIYKNNLKSDTFELINEFREAGYNIKVISGDNPITTLKISQELKIVNNKYSTILVNYDDSDNVKSSHLTISEINPDNSITPIDLQANIQNEQEILQKQINFCKTAFLNNSSFCFSGKAHNFFQLKAKTDHISFKQEFLNKQDQQTQKILKFYQMLIISSQIFARTQPEQKQTIIRLIKESDFVVCMVGDGANDCSAIREADVGISFAEADGQFSSSYVSLSTSLNCVKQVLLEGRVNLSNSVEIFKGYTQIALMRYVGFLALANFYSSYSSNQMDWQAFGSGYFLVYLFLGLNKPLKTLKKSVFDDNLFGIYNTSTVLFAFFLQVFSVIGCLVCLQNTEGYEELHGLIGGEFHLKSQAVTALNFNILIHFFYVLIANHIGQPMKERYYKNIFSYILLWGQFLHANAMIFTSSAYPGPGLDYVNLPNINIKVQIFLISNGCGLIHLLFEHFLTRRLFARLFEKAYHRRRAHQIQSILNDITH